MYACYFHTGSYDRKQVAVKLTLFESNFDQELKIYKALNATDDPYIERKGIPKVFCHGSFISWTNEKVYFIAMTLFDGDLEARLRLQRGNISDLSLSLIFRRSVNKCNKFVNKFQYDEFLINEF